MAKKLSSWCKEVKKAMIDRDMSVDGLAKAIGKTREYTSGVVNGRIYAEPVVKEISDFFNIAEVYDHINIIPEREK